MSNFNTSRLDLNILIIKDPNTRYKHKLNFNNLIQYNVETVDIEDLSSVDLSQYKYILLLEDFVLSDNSLSTIRFYSSVFDCEIVYLSKDPMWVSIMSKSCKSFCIDIQSIDYDCLYSIVYEDMAVLKEYLLDDNQDISDSMDIVRTIMEDSNYDKRAKDLAQRFKSLREIIIDKDKKYELLNKNFSDLTLLLETRNKDNEKLIEGYESSIEEYKRLNSILQQYEVALSKDIFDKVNTSYYSDRPRIIYFKELEEILFFPTFIRVFSSIISKQLHKSVKSLILLNSTDSLKVKRFSNDFHIIRNSFTDTDLTYDCIVKYGDYTKVLDLLLQNKSSTEVLIIYDLKGSNDSVLLGDIHLNLCRNEKHIELYGVDPRLTVVNNGSNKNMSFDFYNDLDEYEKEDKFIYLSSKKVFTNLFSLVESVIRGDEYEG